jgi:electron transfer flavoprotein-quinone oxidoreductase
MADDTVKMDVIVVGGGPAGLAAALTAARAGLEVCVVERGETSGSKNVGGLLYGTVLNELIPDFHQSAPIERPVSRRAIYYLGREKSAGMEFGCADWSREPYNQSFIVFRSQFDRWMASQAEEAGASLLEGMVVDDLVYEGEGPAKKVVGVKIRGDEIFYADVVILADGANSLVTEKAIRDLGLPRGRRKQEFALGVKEIIGLPRETLQDRFRLGDDEGIAMDFFGAPFEGLTGGAFIYTAKEAIHLGVAAKVDSVVASGLRPNEIMERFKADPMIRKLIAGGELLEYSAHLIPEGGYDAVPQLYGNGVMIAGDAAGFVNMSLYKEGTNHAMESGRAAAETAAEAKERGDFSAASLAAYRGKLEAGTVLKDLKTYSAVPHIMEETPDLFLRYPEKAVQFMLDLFTVDGRPKTELKKWAFRRFLKGLPVFRFARDAFRARKLM